MRKTFLLAVLVSFVLTFVLPVKAQVPIKLGAKEYQFTRPGATGDTLAPHDSIRTVSCDVNKTYAMFSSHSLELFHMDASAVSVTVEFQGKYLNLDPDWTTFATAVYKGTVADSIITFNSFTTRQGYNHYRIKASAQTGKVRVKKWNAVYKL